MRLLVVISLFACLSAFGQNSILHLKKPAWVTDYSFEENISDTTQTSDGYVYLLISSQSNLETKEYYRKYVMKVTSQSGLSNVSSINEYFDPAYQKLIFHELNIIRNGKKINKLNPSKFDVIRREEEMDRAVYDKSLNAVYNMPDVRVGDIVEYSFTRTGFNPVFGNSRFGYFYLQYSVPVARFAHKVVFRGQRKLQFKTFGDGVPATEGKSGSLETRAWTSDNVPALLTDDKLPSWYDPYPRVEFSDYQSWNEVKSWARSIYQYPALRKGDLKSVIDGINSSGKSNEEKIKDCIRIAQRSIRYLSFSDGIHGYKPHNPERVYDQKYGDCKDKSFLLSFMLNQIGIQSSPALVSTETGFKLQEAIPNPWAFNHCIVKFAYNDSTYWIDPTISEQVGPLDSYYFPSYYNALVIDNQESQLESIPFGYKNSRIEVKEDYSMLEVGGYVTLKVESSYYGDEADRMRNYFHTNTIDQINKDYLNFYAKDFSDISIEKDIEIIDDTIQNIVSSSEQYLLKNFWTIEDNNKTASIYGSILSTYLKKPEVRLRKMPLSISHPLDVSQVIKIRLPEDWTLEDSRTKVESDGFLYEASKFCSDNVITLRFRYKSKAEYVEASQASEHIDKIDQALATTGVTIFKPLSSSKGNNKNMFVLIAIILSAGIWAVRRFRG
jgi:transglutaminase-like putative cysteine protease